MKLKLFSLLFIFVFGLFGATNAQTKSTATKRYPIRSMIVKFKTESNTMGAITTGTKTLWFDNFGDKEATLTLSKMEMKMLGKTILQETNTLSIINGDWGYTIDLNEKTGTKSNARELKEMAQMMGTAMIANNPKLLTINLKKFVEENNGKWYGAQSFLGKTCDVYEVMGVKQWMYNGVVVKTEGNLGGVKSTEEAISIEENVTIPAEKFKVPTGVEITEVNLNSEE